MVITQSRAAYLGLGIAFTLTFLLQKDIITNLFSLILKVANQTSIKLIVAVLIIVSIPIITDRLWQSLFTFSPQGGVEFRRQFNLEATQLISSNPFWGVGPGMFVPANIQKHPFGINYGFPLEVHNHFLLLIAEFGLPAFFTLIFGVYLLLRYIIRSSYERIIKVIILAGILASAIMMTFHALERLIPLTIIFSLLLESFESHYRYAQKKLR